MFNESDKKILQIVLVVGVVAGLGLFYYYWAMAKYQIKSLDDEITTLAEQKKKKSAELRELKQWAEREDEITQIVAQLEEKVQRLPKTPEARRFFSILRDCIRITNLSANKIARLKPEPMGAYSEIPYQISGSARYHDLGQFLMLVEQHREQIMRVKTLDVRNDMKRPSRHPLNLKVATFVFTQPLPQQESVEEVALK
jgi:Tfp pilus assembly protein PilO